MKTEIVINLIWAVVLVLAMFIGAWYKDNQAKVEKIRLTHPEMGHVLDIVGMLALKASNYQETQDDKNGDQKLDDATDSAYNQIKALYPAISISKDTVRNMVQFAYDTIVAKTNTDLKQEQNNMAKVKNSDNAEQKKDDIVND
ncbi:putative phage holin, LL-H family [Lactobacillus crispatus MV-3A-US]|uniref:phage holin, LLH family n=1 Tax=Lactobacillus crispatus TaxID=47770 RepID=UPI0001BAE4B2|nr:holin [Lactobacillus crispatus]EEX29289.1 putative phage holin, LL-H family [Lactobacillus crispatus MV-3A-US]